MLAAAVASCSQPPRDGSGTGTGTDGGESTTGPGATSGTEGTDRLLCRPGEVRCLDETALEICAPTGRQWDPEPCDPNERCEVCLNDGCEQDRCVGPCDELEKSPSSMGCSFTASRQIHLEEEFPDTVIVANTDPTRVASVRWYHTPEGRNTEELLEEITLSPGEDHKFLMDQAFVDTNSSMFQTGGIYRLDSDLPLSAYQYAPGENHRGNDASLLLPDSALGTHYVVPSYNPHFPGGGWIGYPSYFQVVAIEDSTTVQWSPLVDTAGNGLPIPFVSAGETGSQIMSRFDTMRIAASNNDPDQVLDDRDVSGTVVIADKPVWIVGGSRCSRVPVRESPLLGHCDPLQEVLIPISQWGTEYVAPHPPIRHTENHYWRIYGGGANGTTLQTEPPLFDATNCAPPATLVGDDCQLPTRGSFVEIEVPNGQSLVIRGDAPFMPVGYLQSSTSYCDSSSPDCVQEPEDTATPDGDPAMYQLVSVAQFMDRYVVRTAVGYPEDYIQVIREVGGPDVFLNDEAIPDASYEQVGNFQFATVQIAEGTHALRSEGPFGTLHVGYSQGITEGCQNVDGDGNTRCHSSYAYPGGMRSEPINVP